MKEFHEPEIIILDVIDYSPEFKHLILNDNSLTYFDEIIVGNNFSNTFVIKAPIQLGADSYIIPKDGGYRYLIANSDFKLDNNIEMSILKIGDKVERVYDKEQYLYQDPDRKVIVEFLPNHLKD